MCGHLIDEQRESDESSQGDEKGESEEEVSEGRSVIEAVTEDPGARPVPRRRRRRRLDPDVRSRARPTRR